MRAVYRTVCKNHSGGPASPHTVDCFVMISLCSHGFFDGHWYGQYVDKSRGETREFRVWCEGAGDPWIEEDS